MSGSPDMFNRSYDSAQDERARSDRDMRMAAHFQKVLAAQHREEALAAERIRKANSLVKKIDEELAPLVEGYRYGVLAKVLRQKAIINTSSLKRLLDRIEILIQQCSQYSLTSAHNEHLTLFKEVLIGYQRLLNNAFPSVRISAETSSLNLRNLAGLLTLPQCNTERKFSEVMIEGSLRGDELLTQALADFLATEGVSLRISNAELNALLLASIPDRRVGTLHLLNVRFESAEAVAMLQAKFKERATCHLTVSDMNTFNVVVSLDKLSSLTIKELTLQDNTEVLCASIVSSQQLQQVSFSAVNFRGDARSRVFDAIATNQSITRVTLSDLVATDELVDSVVNLMNRVARPFELDCGGCQFTPAQQTLMAGALLGQRFFRLTSTRASEFVPQLATLIARNAAVEPAERAERLLAEDPGAAYRVIVEEMREDTRREYHADLADQIAFNYLRALTQTACAAHAIGTKINNLELMCRIVETINSDAVKRNLPEQFLNIARSANGERWENIDDCRRVLACLDWVLEMGMSPELREDLIAFRDELHCVVEKKGILVLIDQYKEDEAKTSLFNLGSRLAPQSVVSFREEVVRASNNASALVSCLDGMRQSIPGGLGNERVLTRTAAVDRFATGLQKVYEQLRVVIPFSGLDSDYEHIMKEDAEEGCGKEKKDLRKMEMLEGGSAAASAPPMEENDGSLPPPTYAESEVIERARLAEIARQASEAELARQTEIARQARETELARQAEIERQAREVELARQAEIERQARGAELARQAEIERQARGAELAASSPSLLFPSVPKGPIGGHRDRDRASIRGMELL